MEESAEERRQRLKRLREEAAGQGHKNDSEATTAAKAKEFSDLSFRNYKPRNEVIGARKVLLSICCLAACGVCWSPGKRSGCLLQKEASKPRELDAPAASTLAEAIKDDQSAIDAFAPKKPHMDLKRDVGRQLRKLDRRTAQAIDELRVELEMQEAEENQE